MTESKSQTDVLDVALAAVFFAIPFYGLRLVFQKYLLTDELTIGYVILTGLVSGFFASVYLVVLKPRTSKVKAIGLGGLLAITAIITLLAA